VAFDEEMQPTSVTVLDREVRSWDVLDDGTILSISAALPPTDDDTVLVERRASDGSVLWSYAVTSPDILRVRALADGGVLAAYDAPYAGGVSEVVFLRLSSDGSTVWEWRATGSGASIAARDEGGALVTFFGLQPSLDFGPRHAPLLVELSPEGAVVRAAPLACRGSGSVIDAADGSTILVGGYDERLTLGDVLHDIPEWQLIVAEVK
jgi:hypothetical protein